MYVGRIVAAGRDPAGTLFAGYRVSGRSQPNRRIVLEGESASVTFKDGTVYDNPFVTYGCFRRAGRTLVVSNGSQTRPIAEKILAGLPPKDALASVMLALDYEHDHLNTPRIAALVDYLADEAWMSIVASDQLVVRRVDPGADQCFILATYELTEPVRAEVASQSAEAIAAGMMELPYENPICSIGAKLVGEHLDVSVR